MRHAEVLPPRGDGAFEPNRVLVPPKRRRADSDPEDLDALLARVPCAKRAFEAALEVPLGERVVAADHRAVGEEVVGRADDLWVVRVAREGEELVRERLGAVCIANGDETLADADERLDGCRG